MRVVALPDSESLVKDLVEILSVFNREDKRIARYHMSSLKRCRIPKSQIEDRARQVAQYIVSMETPAELKAAS